MAKIIRNFNKLSAALAYARYVHSGNDIHLIPSRFRPTKAELEALRDGRPLVIGYPGGYVYVKEAPKR